jgi:signal transduction histidine kinase
VTPPDAPVVVPTTHTAATAASDPSALATAVLAATSQQPIDGTLHEIVRAAAARVEATYGALGVLTADGRRLDRFIVHGMDDATHERIGKLPGGLGILGLLVDEPGVLRLDDLGRHEASVGFPAGHPPMRSFLGVPVRVRDAVFGNLYLTEKRTGGPFTAADSEAVEAIAAVAGLAIENARLAERSEIRCEWMQAGTDIATALLSGAEPGSVLRSVGETVCDLTGADYVGVLVSTSDDDTALTIAAAAGPKGADVEGVRVPLSGTHSGAVYHTGVAALVDDIGVEPDGDLYPAVAREITARLGPAFIVPLGSSPPLGLIVAARLRDKEQFDPAVLDPATAFATQTAVALTLARSQRRERRLTVQADRDRIARDLHDHVVQRIFATALSLDRLSRSLEPSDAGAAERLARSVDELDGTISEIRAAIFELHREDQLRPASLRAQLADVVRQVTESHALRRDVRARGAMDELPSELVSDLLAVVRELVTNVVRHASASRVTVTVTVEAEVRVVVTDDGVGLHPAAERSGLANLASRAERRGGRLTATARHPGTQVRWAVPRP